MSLPAFSTQAELFSTAGLTSSLFAPPDRYRLFGQMVYPAVVAARGALEKCYCAENGRVDVEPVLMLGVSLLQYLDGRPDLSADRQAAGPLTCCATMPVGISLSIVNWATNFFIPPRWLTSASV